MTGLFGNKEFSLLFKPVSPMFGGIIKLVFRTAAIGKGVQAEL